MEKNSVPDAAAVVVTEAMLALGRFGLQPRITAQNSDELMRLATLMVKQFGIALPKDNDQLARTGA
jgi:hypothetical protein